MRILTVWWNQPKKAGTNLSKDHVFKAPHQYLGWTLACYGNADEAPDLIRLKNTRSNRNHNRILQGDLEASSGFFTKQGRAGRAGPGKGGVTWRPAGFRTKEQNWGAGSSLHTQAAWYPIKQRLQRLNLNQLPARGCCS